MPYLLLPLYLAGLVGAMLWLAPRTAEAPTRGTESDEQAPTSAVVPKATRADRERPKRGGAVG